MWNEVIKVKTEINEIKEKTYNKGPQTQAHLLEKTN